MRIFIFYILLFPAVMTYSQELYVKYDIEITADNDVSDDLRERIQQGEMTLFVKDKKSRITVDYGNSLIVNHTFINTEKNDAVTLFEGMFGKKFARIDLNKDSLGLVSMTEEVKTINEFECREIVYQLDSLSSNYWITEDIQIEPGVLGKYLPADISFLPLEFVINDTATSSHFTMKELIIEEISDDIFEIGINKEYKEISLAEIRALIDN